MASSAAIKMFAVSMLALFAGQLLMATPAAAAADRLVKGRSLLGVGAPAGCSTDAFNVVCFHLCYVQCVYIPDNPGYCFGICFGKCKY